MAPGSHPTNRWRRWVVLGMVATLIVLAVNAAMSARSPAPARELAEQSYLDRVLPLIQDSTQEGRDIDTVRTQAPSLGVTTVGDRLQAVSTGAAQTLAQARRLTPPASLQTGHDLLVAALAIRSDGAEALRQAMAGAVSGQGSALPVQQLVDVGRDFDAGDRTFALFVAATPLARRAAAGVGVGDRSLGLPAGGRHGPADHAAVGGQPGPGARHLGAGGHDRPGARRHERHDRGDAREQGPEHAGRRGRPRQPAREAPDRHRHAHLVDPGPGRHGQPRPRPRPAATAAAASTTTLAGRPLAPGVSGQSAESVRNFVDLAPGLSRTVDLGGLHPPADVPTTLTVTIQPVVGETATADNTKVIPFVMQ